MIPILVIFCIVLMHWVADFIFQDEAWALGKSKALSPLLKHTATYSILWFPLIWSLQDIYGALLFVGITFAAHTFTDYFTSKVVSKKFAAGKYGSPIPNFGAFTLIGGDQVLHYAQLFGTYYLLFNN